MLLEGIKIIDFTHVWQGPIATQMLADFGAEVIKIERPGAGDWARSYGPYAAGHSLVFAGINRNKKSAVVDIRQPEGLKIVFKLLKDADVMVHNFRPGVVEKLGLDYQSVKEYNPGIVYAYSSGWGDQGPYVDAKRGGHAQTAAATAGLFSQSEDHKQPVPSSISVDYPAGMILSQAILIGIIGRDRTGKSQKVSTDLLSAGVFAHSWQGGRELNQQFIEKGKIDHTVNQDVINYVYATRDSYIEISPVFSQDIISRICKALEIEDLSSDERFEDASALYENKESFNAILERAFLNKTTSEWIPRFEANGVLCSVINTRQEALNDPQVKKNEMIMEMELPEVGTIKVLGNPIRVEGQPVQPRLLPPKLGQHTEEVVLSLGYSLDEIRELSERQVLFGSSN